MNRPRLTLGLSRQLINEELAARLDKPDGATVTAGLRERISKRVVDILSDHEIIILDGDVNVGSVYTLSDPPAHAPDIAVAIELDATGQISPDLGHQIAKDLDTAVGRLIWARSVAAQLNKPPVHRVYVFVIDQAAEDPQV